MKTQNLFKYTIAALLIFGLACSKNDDDNGPQVTLSEKLIGTWKPIEMGTICASGGMDIESLTTCEQSGRLTFNANGSWSETYFYEYMPGTCEDDGISSGTWKIVDGKLFVTEETFGENEITFFEVDITTLKVGQYDNEICGDDNMSSYYYFKYQKI